MRTSWRPTFTVLVSPRMGRAVVVTFVAIVAALSATVASGRKTVSAACADLVLNSGTLTVGTDNPAYPPWYGGGAPKGSKWKINDPSTGKGFESAVAYAVAKQLGFARANVKWVYVPFARAYAPGKKSFDFDINQISYSPARAKVVTFSASYYNVNQAIVVRKGTPIANVHSIAGLRPFKLGAQLGTTSYQYIVSKIKPSQQPSVYQKNDAAVTGAEEQADRRARRRPPDRVLRDRRAGAELEDPRPVPVAAGRRALRDGLPEGQPARQRA